MIPVVAIVGYLVLCLLTGLIAEHKMILNWRPQIGQYRFRIGFWLATFCAVFFTPIVVFVVLLVIPTRTR